MEIKLKDIPQIDELREDINLMLFNSSYATTDDMVFVNEFIKALQNLNIRIEDGTKRDKKSISQI